MAPDTLVRMATVSRKDGAFTVFLMAPSSLVLSDRTTFMAVERTLESMDELSGDRGISLLCMAMVGIVGQMVENMEGNTMLIRDLALASLSGQTAVNTKAFGTTIASMVRGNA